jgi:hypothetical protein
VLEENFAAVDEDGAQHRLELDQRIEKDGPSADRDRRVAM